MASSSSQRMIHQDYIARIRYSNALPPPPNPPKLLDIPNTGLASGQYTTPGFASRLARDQPLNIEADAELGMPLDLVGMPGIFDGDESSIQAPLNPPPVHPHDRALLKPLSALGKPKFADSGVSFLRRTEYISSHTSKSRFESTTSKSLINNVGNKNKRPAHNVDRESPAHIKSEIARSFEIAAQNLKNSAVIRHPNTSKRNLKLVESYPLLPDLDFSDVGGYVHIKFLTNPVPPSNVYDTRLLGSFLIPMEPLPEVTEAIQVAKALHAQDPSRHPAPEEPQEYEFFMPDTGAQAAKFKRKFESPSAFDSAEVLRFKRVRAYETANSREGDQENKYEEVALSAYAGDEDGRRQKAVYYTPIVQKVSIRPQRTKNIGARRWIKGREEEERELQRQTDFVDLRVEEPDEATRKQRELYREHPFGLEAEGEEEGEGDKDADGEEDVLEQGPPRETERVAGGEDGDSSP